MDPLRTTAPRTAPTPRPLLPQHGAGIDDSLIAPWNRMRETGMPAWTRVLDDPRATMDDLAARHPEMRVTWRSDPAGLDSTIRLPMIDVGPKDAPAMVVVAGQHGREPASSAGVIHWIDDLLAARAKGDAQAAWVLGSRRIVVLPIANPRGVKNALSAMRDAPNAPQATFRWNANDSTPFVDFLHSRRNQSGGTHGTDLNRNHASGWHPGRPDDPPPNEFEAFPGSAAASEPETRIIDEVLRHVRPNVVVDAHQFGNYVLATVPAEFTDRDIGAVEHALSRVVEPVGLRSPVGGPAGGELHRIGEDSDDKLGTLQSHAIDAGARLGVTVEAGKAFAIDDDAFPRIRRTFADVLTRFARSTADGAFDMLGPDVSSAARRTAHGWNVGVSDARSGSAAIVGAELVTNPLAPPGSGIPLKPADGTWDEPFEHARVPAELVDAHAGPIGLRAIDANGSWGPVTALRRPENASVSERPNHSPDA